MIRDTHADRAFASFADLSAHLEKLGLFRIRPELGRLRLVLGALAIKERPKAVVQVAGTNGKGSTSTFIAALGAAHGLKVGLFTSPHFVSFRERIRINGFPATEEALLGPANAIMAAGGASLTYFEFITALAALSFSDGAVDMAVMETGLGGTWDAVTALPVDMVAYTPIGLDHCHILGDTVAAIAADKAGAMREGNPVFSTTQPGNALNALKRAARERGCPFTACGGRETLPMRIRDGSVPLGLAGEYQYGNAGLSLAVWRALAAHGAWLTEESREVAALASAFIPGRLQFIPACPARGHPPLLLDGAHNAHGMAALGQALAVRGTAPAAVIFSCLEDKIPTEMAAHLRVLSTGPVFIPPIVGNSRGMSPTAMARTVGLNATPVKDMAEALTLAARHVAERMPEEVAVHPERHPVLVCGSLYMLGDFFSLRPECLEKDLA